MPLTKPHLLPAGVTAPKPGNYFYPVTGNTNGTSANLGVGTLHVTPWICESATTLTRIAVEVSTAGEAGSKIRLGVFTDIGGYYPGALLVDAGQVAGDAVALPEATISLSIARGVYWLASCVQNVTTTQPTLRTLSGWVPPIPFPIGTSLPAGNGTPATHYTTTGVTGAFPATFPGGATLAATVARIILKAA